MRRALICVSAVLATMLVGFGIPSAGAQTGNQPNPLDPLLKRGDRYMPKAAGTREQLKFWFGPYTVPPGHDLNRADLDIPLANGMITQIEPVLRRASDLTEISHQEGHIHHAHWFALDPGNEEDNYTGGNTEWIFGNGDEETRADFEARSAADPDGPQYGQFIGASGPQLMIYMLHNKTSVTQEVYISLDVTFVHGTIAELNASSKRPWHDISGALFGRTFDVPRERNGDGLYESAKDDKRGRIKWTSTVDGTMIGTGGHLHPGGLSVIVENYGSKSNPCPDDGRGYGGTLLLKSDALFRKSLYTEDYQMEVTHPHWRAPLHKGDVIQISGTYENKKHAWYEVMTHEGIYIDEAQKPEAGCAPYLLGQPRTPPAAKTKKAKRKTVKCRTTRKKKSKKSRGKASAQASKKKKRSAKRKCTPAKKKKSSRRRARASHQPGDPLVTPKPGGIWLDPTEGVPNRSWGGQPDKFCGVEWGADPCEPPMPPTSPGVATDHVTIANFVYMPGDRSLSGAQGQPARVKHGTSLTVSNLDEVLNIRHTFTTCPWPCNGRYVANYPLADGVWDSGILSAGLDVVDGANAKHTATTPKNLPVGKYSYFCRIHPWMRGAFEVVP